MSAVWTGAWRHNFASFITASLFPYHKVLDRHKPLACLIKGLLKVLNYTLAATWSSLNQLAHLINLTLTVERLSEDFKRALAILLLDDANHAESAVERLQHFTQLNVRLQFEPCKYWRHLPLVGV